MHEHPLQLSEICLAKIISPSYIFCLTQNFMGTTDLDFTAKKESGGSGKKSGICTGDRHHRNCIMSWISLHKHLILDFHIIIHYKGSFLYMVLYRHPTLNLKYLKIWNIHLSMFLYGHPNSSFLIVYRNNWTQGNLVFISGNFFPKTL